MDDTTRFEERFEERLRAFARTGVRSVDSTAVARAAAARYPKGAITRPAMRPLGGEFDRAHRRVVLGPWRTRSMFKPSLAVAAVVAVLIVGALLTTRRDQPVIGNPSPSLPGVVAPSSTPTATPSATAPNPSAFPRSTGVWIATGSMGTPRSGHTAVRLLDGRVLVAGGANGDENDTSAELYDPASGTWSATGNMANPVGGFPATLLRDGRVLVGDVDDPTAEDDASMNWGAEVYDPASGTWTATGRMVGRDSGSAVLLGDGRVLVVHRYGSSELYEPDSGTWSGTGAMSIRGYNHSAVVLPDGMVLVAGGDVLDSPVDSAELYDPATGTWTATSNMVNPHAHFPATLLEDGRVLVAGGHDPLPPPELYDPAAGTWTTAGDMARPGTSYQSATLLSDGTVLVAAAPEAELYDPGTGSWAITGSMRREHDSPLTLLLDGTVLVAGGADCLQGECVATDSAELYVPAGVSPPPAVAALPIPTQTPSPIPSPNPTPVPPQAGPMPPGARTWKVTVVNDSDQPATLFVAEEDSSGMTRLVGSVTPNVVPAGVTAEVTFRLPAKGVEGWWIFVNPGPDNGALLAGTDVPRAGEIRITADGQVGWLSP